MSKFSNENCHIKNSVVDVTQLIASYAPVNVNSCPPNPGLMVEIRQGLGIEYVPW